MTSPGSGSISMLSCKRRLRSPLLFSGKLNLSSRQPDNEAEESERRRGQGEKFHVSTFAKTFALFCLLGVYWIQTTEARNIDKTKYTTLLAPAAPSAPATRVVKSELVQQQQETPPKSSKFMLDLEAPPEGADADDDKQPPDSVIFPNIFAQILRDTTRNATQFFQALPPGGASEFKEFMAALFAAASNQASQTPSLNNTEVNSTRPLALALSGEEQAEEPTPTLNQIEVGNELDRKLSIEVSPSDRQLPAISVHQAAPSLAASVSPEPETRVVEEAAEPEVSEDDEQLQQDEPLLTALFPPPIDTAPEGTSTVKGHLVDKFGTAIGGGLIDETFSRPISAFD